MVFQAPTYCAEEIIAFAREAVEVESVDSIADASSPREPFVSLSPVSRASAKKRGLAYLAFGAIALMVTATAAWTVWLLQAPSQPTSSPTVTPAEANAEKNRSLPLVRPSARHGEGIRQPRTGIPERANSLPPSSRREEQPKAVSAPLRTSRKSSQPSVPPQLRPDSKDEAAPLSDAERLRIQNVLADLKAKRPKPEPLDKPKKWTQREYLLGRSKAVIWQKWLDLPKAQSKNYWIAGAPIFQGTSENDVLARELLPESYVHWMREVWLQALDIPQNRLDGMISGPFSYLREIKDDDFRGRLRKRAPWQKRAELFKDFAAITGDERPWGLHHPFDELDQQEMVRAIKAARQAKEIFPKRIRGEEIQPMKREDFQLLVKADQYEFLIDLLTTAHERAVAAHERAIAAREKEQKRKAEEEEALRRYQKEHELDKKREAARQRQMEIEADDKKAKKLLRAALLLDARGGFDKQVRQQLQDIIDKYPDTPTAQRAKRQLDKMAK